MYPESRKNRGMANNHFQSSRSPEGIGTRPSLLIVPGAGIEPARPFLATGF